MPFSLDKKRAMLKLEHALAVEEVDLQVIPLLNAINAHNRYYTTSSCAGRLLLISPDETGRKNLSVRPLISHEPLLLENIWPKVLNWQGDVLWFKMEPFILHVVAKDLDSAKVILDMKTRIGIKRGGIFTIKPERIIIELEGTQRIDFPIKLHGKLLLTKEQFLPILDLANDKLKRTQAKLLQMERFFKGLNDS